MSRFDYDMSPEGLGLSAEDLGERLWLSALAEFIATLLFVFIGCGSVVTLTGALEGQLTSASLVGIALAHGLAIATLVAATARISGGHINPAVTFAAVLTGRIKAGPGVIYVAAQLLGAVIGALLLEIVLVDAVEGGLGAHALNDNALSSTGAGVIVEIILTFILVFVVFATAMDPRGPGNLAPIAIGLAVLDRPLRRRAADGRVDEPRAVVRTGPRCGRMGRPLGLLGWTAPGGRSGRPALLRALHARRGGTRAATRAGAVVVRRPAQPASAKS